MATLSELATILRLDVDAANPKLAQRVSARLVGIGVKDVCGRCGGSGRYSFNQIDGDRCYGCGGPGHRAPKLNAKTLERARAAVEAGELDRYLAHRKAVAEAKRQVKPLAEAVRAVLQPISDAYMRASDRVDRPILLRAGRESRLFRFQLAANAIYFGGQGARGDTAGALDVVREVNAGRIDPEVGAVVAVAVLRERLAEAEVLAAEFAAAVVSDGEEALAVPPPEGMERIGSRGSPLPHPAQSLLSSRDRETGRL